MVTFIELRGDGADRTLRALAAERRDAGERCELLIGRDQPDVVLLMCWGEGPDRLPDGGARRWTFDRLEGAG